MRPIEFFFRAAEMYPDRSAIESPGESPLTYVELAARVLEVASALQSLDDVPRSRVCICAGNTIDHVVTLLATLAADKIWVPLNPRAGINELQRIVDTTRPALIIAEAFLAGRIDGRGARFLAMDELALLGVRYAGERPVLAAHTPDQIQAIKFTGGTTGPPKGVMQSLRAWNAVIISMLDCFQFQADERFLALASLTHGTSTFLLPLLARGGAIVFAPSANAGEILDCMEHERISAVFMPPTLIYRVLEDPSVRRRDWSRLRHFLYGAAPMRPERIREARSVFGRIETCYGQTESPSIVTFMSAKDFTDDERIDSVGRPTLMTEVAIMDVEGRLLQANEVGEIVVRGDLVMSGYWEQPAATAAAFSDGWLRTGDGGYLDDKGFLYLKDRLRDVIISGGINVYPVDVEQALGQHPAVHDCIVFGVDDSTWGEAVHAVVQLRVGCTVDEAELVRHVKLTLDPIKAPKRIQFLAELPRTSNGKLSRKAIKEHLLSSITGQP